jgi:hypothetical protein
MNFNYYPKDQYPVKIIIRDIDGAYILAERDMQASWPCDHKGDVIPIYKQKEYYHTLESLMQDVK